MGSKTFDGVRFAAFSNDHPPHVHGHYAGVIVVVDLLINERAVRVSRRARSIRPANAKRSDINYVRETALKYFNELVALWESKMNQEVRDVTTDADIQAALEKARTAPPEPLALAAEYNREFDMIILRLDDGRRLLIPREEMQGLENATPEQLTDIQIFSGVDLAWPQLDVDHYLPYLLEGRYATERWKEQHRKSGVVAA